MSKKVYFTDFGCRLNQFETRVLENFDNELEPVLTPEEADVIVINTCTVTGRADMKNRQAIRKSRLLNPEAEIIVTGCYASTDAEAIQKMDSHIRVVENQRKFTIPGLILGKKTGVDTGLFPPSKQNRIKNARAYLKIQDGCNKQCSYCKIPAARGKGVSRSPESTIREVHSLIESGFAEIILTGVNIGHYRSGKIMFNEILRELQKIPGDHFYRISSIEPECINNEFIEIMQSPAFAKFLHVPLQSGSNRVLRAMRRGYTIEKFAEKVDAIRQRIPEIHIGTDVMVGFPGETDEDFQETRAFLQQLKFSNVHFFPFSQRAGSEVDRKLAQGNKDFQLVNGRIVKDRIQMLIEEQKEISSDYIQRTSGIPFRAVIENIGEKTMKLVSENYLRSEVSLQDGFAKGQKCIIQYDPSGNFTIQDYSLV